MQPCRLIPSQHHPGIDARGRRRERGLGPTGYHAARLRRALRRAVGIAAMAGLPVPEVYAQAAWMALNTGRIMVLIECQEPTEGDWNSCVKETAPEVPRLIVTPMPENTA